MYTVKLQLLVAVLFTVTLSSFADAQLLHRRHQPVAAVDLMDTRQMRLIDYRRLFMRGTTPTSADLIGTWRGVNKGIVEAAGYRQFIKEITPVDCQLTGSNIAVHQVSNQLLRCCGWQPQADSRSWNGLKQTGNFAIRRGRTRGAFGHGVEFNYRQGNNRKGHPARVLVDRVVKIDDHHLLGRAVAKFGPIQIPLAYFVLERM